MYNWSLWLSLAVICYTSSVQSQSCLWNYECNTGKCCRTGKCAKEFRSPCPCQHDNHCKSYEECREGLCYFKKVTPYTFNWPTWRPYTFKNPQIPSFDVCNSNSDCSGSLTCISGRCLYYSGSCVWDSDCPNNKNCEDGVCMEYDSSSGGIFTGGRVLGIVLFVVVTSIVSFLYHLCKRGRRQPLPASRNGNVNAPPTGVAVGTNEHQLRCETASSNALAVQGEGDCPLPPNAPPPYNSLEFESQQNGNVNDLPEQPPPSYDEAVRNSGVPPV